MNISQLECFASLANTLNFVKTADQLALSQPAVSKQIRALETELGTKLFERTSRSVSLTPVGEQFLPEVTDMLNILYRSKNWISAYTGANRNPLRIGYTDPLMMPLVSELLKEYLSKWPDVVITPELAFDQTDANLGRLQKSQLDCLLSMRDARFDDCEIIFTPLQTCGFLCCVSKTHPIAREYLDHPEQPLTISTDQFMPYRQIIATPPYLMKRYYSRGHRILPVNDEADNIICSNTNEAYALVLSGIGYSMIPEYLRVDHPDALFLEWTESQHAPFGVYYRKAKDKASPLSRFIQIAKKHFSEMR